MSGSGVGGVVGQESVVYVSEIFFKFVWCLMVFPPFLSAILGMRICRLNDTFLCRTFKIPFDAAREQQPLKLFHPLTPLI